MSDFYRFDIALQLKNEALWQLKIIDETENCEACNSGKGCGKRLWFRFLGQKDFYFSANQLAQMGIKNQSSPLYLQLILPHYFFALSAFIFYGLPLIIFLMVLFFCQALPEYLQFILSFGALIASFYLISPIEKRFLKHFIRFEPAIHSAKVVKMG